MDDPKAWVECINCAKNFVLRASVYEKVVEDDEGFFCEECLINLKNKEMQEEIENQPKRSFEYRIGSPSIQESALNALGSKGWEMCGATNNTIYFKKEMYK